MTVVADILDFLFVFLPVSLLTHLAFRIGLVQGRSKGGISLFVGSSIVVFSFLFKVYFDVVFGRADSFWLFILTLSTSIGLLLAFIGVCRVYLFLVSTRSIGIKVVSGGMKVGMTIALIYAIAFISYLMFVESLPYLRLGAVCYVVNQVFLFGMVFLAAEFFSIVERSSSSSQGKFTRVFSSYYLIEPLIWLVVITSTNDFYLPQILRIAVNVIGVVVSSIVALFLLQFVRLYLPSALRRLKTTYLDNLRVNVLRDLYIIGSGLTIFIFVILLVAESFYEDIRISTLKSYAESKLSIVKLTTERIRSTLQDVASKLQSTPKTGDPRLYLTHLQGADGYINAVGVASNNGQVTLIKNADVGVPDSQIISLFKESVTHLKDSNVALSILPQKKPGLEFFVLAVNNSRRDLYRFEFAVVNIQKSLDEGGLKIIGPEYGLRILTQDLRVFYSRNLDESGENFSKAVLAKNNLDMNDLTQKLRSLARLNFSGYEILKGKNNSGVGEYYLLMASPFQLQSYKLILVSLESEAKVPRLFDQTNSLLILAVMLVIGLFGGAAVLISISFRWSLRLEKEVQNKIDELRSSEDKYRRIVENPYFGSFITVDGRLIFSNNRLAGILETVTEQLAGSDLSSFIDEKDIDSLKAIFAAIIAGEKSGDKWQVEGKTASGRQISLSGYSSIINIGNKRGVQSLVIDNTSEFREKEKMEQFEKLESMATLAAGIAHDFNNILQVVLGSSQLLQHKLDDADLRKYADNITNVAIRGSDLSKRLLTFSRKKGLEERKIFDVNSLIVESLHIFQETFPRNIKIETQLNNTPIYVEGDQSQIQQVIFNLAVNARDAMPHGGTLLLKTEIRETSSSEAEIYQVDQGKYSFIMVKDNGEGIPPELMTKVFEPFFTTKEPGRGTGLGLSVVYGIVRSHKGFLKVYSEVKKGTVFNIYLPLTSQAEKKVIQPQRTKEPAIVYGKKILFVDDEEGIREAAKFLLEEAGYTVTTAKDGIKAIEIYQKDWTQTNLVILDLNMPELSGREVLDNLFIINPDVRVLISTGYITPEERVGLRGVVEVIEKPFDFDQLVEKVRNATEWSEVSKK